MTSLVTMIDVILPCLNEAEALPRVLANVPHGIRPLVVDNGSADGSAEIAERLGASVIRCQTRGYGAACHAGLVAATSEVVAFCDCDGSLPLDAVPRLASEVLDGSADLAIARRRVTSSGGWPWHARSANRVLAWHLRRHGVPVHDVGPIRVARRARLLELEQQDRRSGYPLETLLLAGRAGWRVVEHDVEYLPRLGKSKVTGTVRGTAQAVRDMSVVMAR